MTHVSVRPMQFSGEKVWSPAVAGGSRPQLDLLDVLAELRQPKQPLSAFALCDDETPSEPCPAAQRPDDVDAALERGPRPAPLVAFAIVFTISALLWLAILGA